MPTLSPTRADPAPAVSSAAPAASALESLLADVRRRSAEFERQRFISPDIIERLKQLGVYRALVPRRLGGEQRSAREFCELVETIAQADGSTGWVASFGMAVTYLAALPPATLRQIYADSPDVVFAGGIFPPQRAPRVAGGFEVSGRWAFASGCMGANLIGVGISPTDGEHSGLPRMAVMPRAQVTIEPTWEVMGLTGTGSHDLVVDRVVVPEDWTFVRGSRSLLDEPMFRYPTLSFAAQVLAVVGLGIARGAIEELRGLASGRISVTGAPRLADRPQVQIELARAEAQLRAARAFFYEAIDDAWDSLLRGDDVSPEQTSTLRLSATHAARVGAEVTRAVQMQTGMTGVYDRSPIARQVRDSLVLTQHAFLGDITYQNAGAMLFGQPALPGYL
ncbi:alkylation response protein AidB-like acyl-CoA dehydrogenase [Sphaerotilus hippei]|uniref:Alkylation response protein AidB-like acyl-CoA dehydrogenase n=1 Tax=Sphaerotilus hippei TaxID=744406 RepID=A0A318H6L9_9BURK|nr:acyl-CoA dehydrogenase family protein [Sphaerotilus hippei]PXW99371.1 alkylation response protein AidB-like acyl-CoA dehydrogenase [Sphaerotilus hippei]